MRSIIFILIVTLCSCSNSEREKNSIVFKLTNDNAKYWNISDYSTIYSIEKDRVYPLYCMYFDKKGIWKPYIIINDSLILDAVQDVKRSFAWELLSNSSLSFDRRIFEIAKITADTIILLDEHKRLLVLANNIRKISSTGLKFIN